MIATPPEIHTLDEAAAILRVKRSWLERQAAGRRIPFTMLGGAYHFTSAHLEAIVRIHERMPAVDRQAADRSPSARRAAGRQQPGSSDVKPLRPRPRPTRAGRLGER